MRSCAPTLHCNLADWRHIGFEEATLRQVRPQPHYRSDRGQEASLAVIAHDVDLIELVVSLPGPFREVGVPSVVVKFEVSSWSCTQEDSRRRVHPAGEERELATLVSAAWAKLFVCLFMSCAFVRQHRQLRGAASSVRWGYQGSKDAPEAAREGCEPDIVDCDCVQALSEPSVSITCLQRLPTDYRRRCRSTRTYGPVCVVCYRVTTRR